MKKIWEFLKTNFLVIKWTFWYFLFVWAVLQFVFGFDMFSLKYWERFFRATLHGFSGFVFGTIIYTFIPIYLATVITVYRKHELIITIPFVDKIFNLFKKAQPAPEPEPEQTEPEETANKIEYPADLPPELRVPYTRVKNNLSLTGAVSVYNRQPISTPKAPEHKPEENSEYPIPMDFDISEDLTTEDTNIPQFTDLDFGTPIANQHSNSVTKYFDLHDIEYEQYRDFVATEKYVIYPHIDDDFWIMDEDNWFASGKQMESPLPELKGLAKQNGLIPVLYLESTNIMNLNETIKQIESTGIKVIKDLDEL